MVSGAAVLAAGLLICAAPVAAQEHPNDGLVHATVTFELVKRVHGAQRSALRPNAVESPDRIRRRKGEAQRGLEQLGHQLEPFLTSVRGARSPYPLLRDLILDYAHLRPIDQSDENGRMYIMYIGELYWPFPAPLLADLLRIRIRSPVSQATRDLLTVALRRWGRDTIEAATQEEALRRRRILGWLDSLESPGLLGMRWRRDQVINDLLRARLSPSDVARLRAAVASDDVTVQLGALRVLGTGGWVDDPTFYVPLLKHPAIDVQRAAFWALVFMRGDGALETLRTYAGRDEAVAARFRKERPVASALSQYNDVVAFDQRIGAPIPPPPPAVVKALAEASAARATAPVPELTPTPLTPPAAQEPAPLPEPAFPN